MSDLRIHSADFERKLGLIASLSARGAAEEAKIQAKGIVRTAILEAPPGGPKIQGPKAAKRGRARIELELNRTFLPVIGDAEITTRSVLKSTHDRLRNNVGRIPARRGQPKISVESKLLEGYIRDTGKDTGILAAGFNASAAKLGYKPPAFVWRHNTPGAVRIEANDRRVVIRMTNKARFASNVATYEDRIQRAMDKQAGKIERQLPFVIKAAARRAGLKAKA